VSKTRLTVRKRIRVPPKNLLGENHGVDLAREKKRLRIVPLTSRLQRRFWRRLEDF